jgi:hypothetical protein
VAHLKSIRRSLWWKDMWCIASPKRFHLCGVSHQFFFMQNVRSPKSFHLWKISHHLFFFPLQCVTPKSIFFFL